jgi:hypothetical protein
MSNTIDSKTAGKIHQQLKEIQTGTEDTTWPANSPKLAIDQASYDQPGLLAETKTIIAPFDTADAAYAAWRAAIVARDLALPAAIKFVNGVYTGLPQVIGVNNPDLVRYGKKPKKARAQQTAAQKAQSAALRKATREARGTMGKKEKAKIHGTLPSSGGTSGGGTPPAAPPAPTTTGH